MSKRAQFTYKRPWITFAIAVLAGVAVVVLHAVEPRVLAPLERYNYDLLMQLRTETPAVDDCIVILGLDNGDQDFIDHLAELYLSTDTDDQDDLIDMFGGRELPSDLITSDFIKRTELMRLVHARFLEACAEMRVAAVVWDVAFDSKRRPDVDDPLSQAMQGVPTFLMVEGRLVEQEQDTRAEPQLIERFRVGSQAAVADVWHVPHFRVGQIRPDEQFWKAAAGGGHVAYTLDADGVMRRTPIVTNANNRLFPSLPFAVALRALDPQNSDELSKRIRWDGSSVVLPLPEGDQLIPLDEQRRMSINYVLDWFSNMEVRSYYKTWEDVTTFPEDFAETYRGKILVIGETASYTNDLVTSPLDFDLPGVTALTNALNTVLTGQFITPTPRWLIAAITILISLTLGGVYLIRSLWLSIIVTAIVFVGVIIASPLLYFTASPLFFPIAMPLVATVIAASAAIIAALSRAYRWATKLSTILARFVSPALLEELYRHGITRQSLAPVREEITVLFVDIAGFTSLSEVIEPEELSEFLTVWYEEAMAVLVENHGTLDKFLGDGVLAYFGAPEPLPDKVAWAARAAIGLQERFEMIADKLSKSRKTLKIRAGLCTGYATVGYLGGDRFAAYTILGRAVNMAARLEQNAVPGQIAIEKKTWAHLEDRFVMEPLEPITAKGIDRPIEAWRLVREKTTSERLGETVASDS